MTIYDRNHPFKASIKERYSLCGGSSIKDTRHVVLDISGSGITYQPGDSLGIYPINDPSTVEKTLHALGASGEESIFNKRRGETVSLKEFLTSQANLTEISRKFLQEGALKHSDSRMGEFYESLLDPQNKADLKEYLESHHVWDFFQENQEVKWQLEELPELLMPLLPRLYSISSSQAVVGDEVHLAVAMVRYRTNDQDRVGVCTHFLGELTPVGEPLIPVYLQATKDFVIPTDPSKSIVMIGPGTGIAPFRAFMQERIYRGDAGGNWLFFGECHQEHHYFFRDFWEGLEKKGVLKVDVAFSRDQPEKVYVQHRMIEKGKELFSWIENGAVLYVCGDKHRMAKDVEDALLTIFQMHGEMDRPSAETYLKVLRKEKRYLRDVY